MSWRKTFRRREILQGGLSGLLASTLLGRRADAQGLYPAPGGEASGSDGAAGEDPGHAHGHGAATPVVHSAYGGEHEPPPGLGPGALDRVTLPPPPITRASPEPRVVDLWIGEQPIEVARDKRFEAWTYNGQVPGPIVRAHEGETLHVRFENYGAHPHNVHFHGRHDVNHDGWQPIPAGGTERYEIVAEPFGLHPYHCHALPVSQHVAKGLYGTLIVDPPGGRPPAHELALTLCGFDLDGDGRNEIYAWNGVAGFYSRYPIKVPVGELVRVYITNMVSGDPIGSFHLHAETFDVYRTGTRLEPDEHTDVVSLTQAERAIVEFRLPRRGRYMFHPHQIHMAERGAMGWFSAI